MYGTCTTIYMKKKSMQHTYYVFCKPLLYTCRQVVFNESKVEENQPCDWQYLIQNKIVLFGARVYL